MNLKQLRYIVLTGIFLIPFIPLYVSKSLLFPFITGKAFAFRVIVEIIFACYLVLALKYEEYRPKFSWTLLTVALFTIIIGIADFWSENPFKSFWSNYERMEGYISLLHFVAYFIVLIGVFNTRNIWNKFFATNIAASAIMAIYSFLQIAGKITINQGGVRVDGTFGNATYLAIYMVFNIFFAAYLYLNSKRTWQKTLLGVVALADLVVLYYTATRGAILGLIGGGLITFIILLFRSEKGDKIRKAALFSIIAIAAIIGVFLISKNNSYVRTNPVLSRFATLSFSELQTQGRFYVWPIAVKGFLERPILGWGQESFNFVFNKYYDPRMYNQEPWFDRAHDIILDWLIAGGLLGLLSYLVMFGAMVLTIFKSVNLSKNEKAVFLGLSAAYFFHNIFVFDQIGSYIMFFSLLAFMHMSSSNIAPAWVNKISEKSKNIFTKESLFPVWSSLIVIAIAYTLYAWQYVPIRENKNLMKVLTASALGQISPITDFKTPLADYNMGFPESLEHISEIAIQIAGSSQADQSLKQQVFDTVNDAYKKQLTIASTDTRYQMFYGLFLTSFGDYNDALTQYQAANASSPNKQSVYFELGSTYITLGRPADALAAFKKAYELEPSYEEARFLYGLGALASGDTALSEQLLSGVSQDKLLFDDRLISILAALKRYNDIINIAKERLKRDPTNMQYHMTLAAAYLQSGQRQAAISVIEEMIKINPSFKDQGDYYIKEIQAGRNP